MRKALVIGPRGIDDLGDLVAIARAEGGKALRVDKVRVLPWLKRDDQLNFVVLIEAHNSPGAGDKRTRE